MKINNSKNYNNLRFYLKRIHNIKNSGILAGYLLDKISNHATPTQFMKIYKEELEIAGVLKKGDKLYEWREEMCKKQILICKADLIDKKSIEANFKCGEFKFGQSIKKYMEIAIIEKKSILERIDSKANLDYVQEKFAFKEDLFDLEMQMKETRSIAATKEELNDLRLEVQDLKGNYENMILFFMPPDNETRRKIIQKYGYNKEECVEMLKKDNFNYQ